MDLKESIVKLYEKCACDLPKDVEDELKQAAEKEKPNSLAQESIKQILNNIKLSRENKTPICQDTGTPIFYIEYTDKSNLKNLKDTITEATREATQKIPLRPNAVDPITGKNSNDNTGKSYPILYFREGPKQTIKLMLKGGGSENIGRIYKLPDKSINAGRDIEGVRRCILDAMVKAQGKGCSPNYIGVAIGGSKDIVSRKAKAQLLRKVNEKNKDPVLAQFEELITEDINKLGIGPLGLGGKTTCLGVKLTKTHRHPASFIVDVAFSCWATRRYTLDVETGEIE